jgi:hypothetical protein
MHLLLLLAVVANLSMLSCVCMRVILGTVWPCILADTRVRAYVSRGPFVHTVCNVFAHFVAILIKPSISVEFWPFPERVCEDDITGSSFSHPGSRLRDSGCLSAHCNPMSRCLYDSKV